MPVIHKDMGFSWRDFVVGFVRESAKGLSALAWEIAKDTVRLRKN
jgi:hypothetical protein